MILSFNCFTLRLMSDEKIIDGGSENSVSWFKKKTDSREVIEALFNPVLKVSKDKEMVSLTDVGLK